MKKPQVLPLLILALALVNPANYAWAQGNLRSDVRYAPAFDLVDIQGAKLRSAQLKGKITVLAFWATWCYWCRREIPNLNKLHSLYKDKGIEVVGISVDQRGIMDVGPFLKVTPINYRILIGSPEMATDLNIFGLPRIMVIDKDWKIYRDYPGYIEFEALEKDVLALSAAGKKITSESPEKPKAIK